MLTGGVKGTMNTEHKSKDFIAFLKKLDRECPKGKVLHLILDNYSTHRSKETFCLGQNTRERLLHYVDEKLAGEFDEAIWEFWTFLLKKAKSHRIDVSGYVSLAPFLC